VHHDPVVKHRAAPSQNERRRGKGGANTGGAQQNGNGVTHAITDDAKNALAQIAASTLAHSHEVEHAETPVREAVPGAQAVPDATEGAKEPSRAGSSRRGRRGTGSRDAAGAAGDERAETAGSTKESTGSTDSGSGDQDGTPVAILDIPVAPLAPAQKPRIDTREAEQLLDSVLEALQAPKQPGQGRGRSRRVTTAALTGTVITPEPKRDQPAE
jgi:ribonuclease E